MPNTKPTITIKTKSSKPIGDDLLNAIQSFVDKWTAAGGGKVYIGQKPTPREPTVTSAQ